MSDRSLLVGRRTFGLGLAAAAAASISGIPAVARAEGGKLLIVGGSTIKGALGMYIEKHFKKLGYEVRRQAKSSSGLARPDFYDWPGEAGKLVESFQPDATVVMFGGNDGQGLYMGRNADPKWVRWPDNENWRVEYHHRVAAFAETLAPDGEQVFWIGMPIVRDPGLSGRLEIMNGIYQAEMAVRPNGHFLPTWDVLTKADGSYTDRIDGTRVRAGDGVHLSGAGATMIVDRVAPEIEAKLG